MAGTLLLRRQRIGTGGFHQHLHRCYGCCCEWRLGCGPGIWCCCWCFLWTCRRTSLGRVLIAGSAVWPGRFVYLNFVEEVTDRSVIVSWTVTNGEWINHSRRSGICLSALRSRCVCWRWLVSNDRQSWIDNVNANQKEEKRTSEYYLLSLSPCIQGWAFFRSPRSLLLLCWEGVLNEDRAPKWWWLYAVAFIYDFHFS